MPTGPKGEKPAVPWCQLEPCDENGRASSAGSPLQARRDPSAGEGVTSVGATRRPFCLRKGTIRRPSALFARRVNLPPCYGAPPRCDRPSQDAHAGLFFVGTATRERSYLMRCFFLRDGQIVGFEMLPPGLSTKTRSRGPHSLFQAQGPVRRLRGLGQRPRGIQAS